MSRLQPGQSGASHDADPCGTYRTEPDGSVVFEQAGIVCPRYVPCKTSLDVDKLVAKVLLASARHAHRHLTVERGRAKNVLWRLGDGKVWVGSADVDVGPDTKVSVSVTEALPSNVLVKVAGHPEEFGRLCYDCGGFGVSILAIHRLSVIEMVPTLSMGRVRKRIPQEALRQLGLAHDRRAAPGLRDGFLR